MLLAFAKISFSKLKLIKSYLKLTMSQKRFSRLVISSIETEMLEELEHKNLISQFCNLRDEKYILNEIYYNIKKYINVIKASF